MISLIISDHEVRLLQDTFSVDPILLHHLPFMVDLKHLPPSGKAFSRRRHFATIGNFRHPPNWDAVLYLQQIWPLIRKVLPDTELHIYGAYPPKKAMALDNPRTGFRIRGWADDAHAVLSDARACLAPLRFGAGLLDAMLAGTPQACLRPRDRFWDIPVPKIDSAFDNLSVPQPSSSPSTTQQLRKLVAAPYLPPNDWTPCLDAYFVFPLAQGTPGKQCGLAATGVYQPSLRSPWLAASVTTGIGAEGMSGGLPWPGSIASGAEEIARAAIALHENEALWQDCRQRITPLSAHATTARHWQTA